MSLLPRTSLADMSLLPRTSLVDISLLPRTSLVDMSLLPRTSLVDISLLPHTSLVDISLLLSTSLLVPGYFLSIVWLICSVCTLRHSCCEHETHLVHRSFYSKLNLCCVIFGLFSVTASFKLVHLGKSKRNINFKTEARIRMSNISLTCLWGVWQCGHLDLKDIFH
jgi:hypothetical protein